METDGAVRALTGGPDYGESQFNRATHAKRQPGSSFKIYVYATALENGYTPTTSVRDASRSCGRWHPQNYGGSHGGGGRMPMWMALAKSLNTVAAELSFAVGRDKVHRHDAPRRHYRHPQDLLDGARRLRHQPARARGRRRDLRQRRQARQALRHPRSRQLQGRPRLQPRPRRAGSPAGRRTQGRRRAELDDEQGRHRRYRPARPSSTSPTSPARPAPRPAPRTSGSSASPASTSASSGSATTTTARCRREPPAAISRRRSGIRSCPSYIPT